MKKWRVAGINFDHMHMGDLLRMAANHPAVDLVGVSDEHPEKMQWAVENVGLAKDRMFVDYRQCLEKTKPDMVILCPATAKHAEWTEKVAAAYPAHIFMEKPFAVSLAEADRMIAAVKKIGKQLVINWPLRWYPSHVTAKRLCDEGVIGEVIQVHYYDGNRGPMRHLADKVEVFEEANKKLSESWFYQCAAGGGSMLDYLGYGTTLGTWYLNGKAPIEVTAAVDQPPGLEVDQHSVTVARYDTGLSKFETRWGTLNDPWILQPQPKCGFVLVGRNGSISSFDFEKTIRVQTKQKPDGFDVPVDTLKTPFSNPIEYFLHCIETNTPADGPLSPKIARIGQQIVDTAYKSAQEKRTLPLIG